MSSTVSCTFANWEVNSWGQNACQMYAELQGRCNSTFVISHADSTDPPYRPPNNACGCNVVAYNLMAGCGWCQSSIPNQWWLTVSQWSGQCTAVQYNPSGLPTSISTSTMNIPSWAFTPPTGTSWNPSEASALVAPAVPTYYGSTSRASAALALAAGLLVALLVLLGISVLCCIMSCVIHYQRQTRRRPFYSQTAAYYLAQRGGYGYNPYAPNVNPGALGSSVPLVQPGQPQPQPHTTAHVRSSSFGPVHTSITRGPRSAPADMTEFRAAPLTRGEPTTTTAAELALNSADSTPPGSPVVRGGFGEAGGSGAGTGGDVGTKEMGEVVSPRRSKSVSFGGHAASLYPAHMANVGVVEEEKEPRSLLPYAERTEEGSGEEVPVGSKGKARAL